MKFIHTILIVPFIFIVVPAISFSQTIKTSDYNSFSIGVKGGLQYFYGDIRQQKYLPDNKYKKSNTCFGLEATKNLNSIFGIRLGAMTGNLSGSSPNLDMHFLSKIKQYTFEGIINLNDLISFYPKKEKMMNAYIFAGVGMLSFWSKVFSYIENTYVGSVGWDSTGNARTAESKEIIFPLGIGMKFKADQSFDFGIEFSMQLTNTDKLDAWMVSKSYMDRYSNLTASVTYKIGGKKEYVDWVNPFMDSNEAPMAVAQGNVSKENNNTIKQTTIENPVKTTTAETTVKTNTMENPGKTSTNTEMASVSKSNQNIIENKAAKKSSEKSIVSPTIIINTENSVNAKITPANPTTFSNTSQTTITPATTTQTNKQATPVTTTTTTTPTTTTATATPIVKKFFIIAGSYPSEQLANDAVAALIARGYAAAEVVGKNDAGNYRICFKAFATREDANKDLPAVKLKNSSAWIFEKK